MPSVPPDNFSKLTVPDERATTSPTLKWLRLHFIARAERSLPDQYLMASQEAAKQAKNAVESAAKKAAEARQQCAKHDPPSMFSVVPLGSIAVAHCHPSRMFHTGSPLCCSAPEPWRANHGTSSPNKSKRT
jgi:hypothetical protein